MKTEPRLLIVDDDPATATMLSRSLSRHGFLVDAVGSPAEALVSAATTEYDAAVLDLVMPGLDGTELAAALRAKSPGLPVALLTGYMHSPLVTAAKRAGVVVFAKPLAVAELVDFLKAELG